MVSSNTGSEEFCYNQEILNIFTYPHFWKINKTYNHWLILFIALFIAAVNAKVIINILWTLKTIKRFSFVSIRDFLARLHFRYINNLFPDTDMDALMLFASWAMVMMHLEAGEGFMEAGLPGRSWSLGWHSLHPWRHGVMDSSWHLSWLAHHPSLLSPLPRCQP